MGINVDDCRKFKEKTIPGGWIGMKITEIQKGNSSKTGAEMGVVSGQIIDETPIGVDVDMDNYLNPLNTFQKFWVVTPDDSVDLTKKQYEGYGLNFKKFVKACGFDGIEDVLDGDNNVDWKKFIGQELEVKIVLEPVEEYPDDVPEDEKEFRASVKYGGYRPIKM